MQVEVSDAQTIVYLMRGGAGSIAMGIFCTLLWLPFVAGSVVCLSVGLTSMLQIDEALRFDPQPRIVRYEKTYALSALDNRWSVAASEVRSVHLDKKTGEDITWTLGLDFQGRNHQIYSGSSQERAEQLA